MATIFHLGSSLATIRPTIGHNAPQASPAAPAHWQRYAVGLIGHLALPSALPIAMRPGPRCRPSPPRCSPALLDTHASHDPSIGLIIDLVGHNAPRASPGTTGRLATMRPEPCRARSATSSPTRAVIRPPRRRPGRPRSAAGPRRRPRRHAAKPHAQSRNHRTIEIRTLTNLDPPSVSPSFGTTTLTVPAPSLPSSPPPPPYG